MRQFKIVFALLILSFGLQAQLNTYDYFREINPVKDKGYYQIRIGSSILDRDGYYRVYKLSSKDTTEIPYVTERYDWSFQNNEYFKDLKIIDKSYESNKYSYSTLVIDTNITYTSVYLNFSGNQFFKDVTIEGSQDNKKWQTITENEKMFRYLPANDGHYFRNRIDFDAVSFKYIRVKVDDAESEKLDLLSATIPLVKQELIQDGELVECFQKRTEDKKNKQTIIDCQFARAYTITDFQMFIENESPYHRSIQIEFFNPVNGKENWVPFGGSVITSNSKNKIYIPQMGRGDFQFKSSRMRILILNNDDQPLTNITLKAYTYQEDIRLKLEKNEKYLVAYGKKDDVQPSYDLDYYKNMIALVGEVGLGTEQKIPHEAKPVQQPLISNKTWIWVALIACVLVIGIFATRLMKQGMVK
jgi:hypothetical protein